MADIYIRNVTKETQKKYNNLKKFVKSKGMTVEFIAKIIFEKAIDDFMADPDFKKFM